ncbi:hypothetical protein Dimus_000916 [Dionaea muscipula]
MTVIHLKKKDIVKSKVRGIEMEFDHEKSATILEVWEESKYTKPLEITRRFANDENIMASKKGQVGELKPFQRFIHFSVMKNVVPMFGKRDTSSFLDLTYMDHLMSRRKINLPRVMIRHMSYVISMKDPELPYGDRLTMVFQVFRVPLVDKKGEEPKRYDFFEETFLTMCKLTKENGIWWIGSGENRRRDDDVNAQEGEAKRKMKGIRMTLIGKRVIDKVAAEGNPDPGERFYDAEDETQGSPEVQEEIPPAAPQSSAQQKEQDTRRVDPRSY